MAYTPKITPFFTGPRPTPEQLPFNWDIDHLLRYTQKNARCVCDIRDLLSTGHAPNCAEKKK